MTNRTITTALLGALLALAACGDGVGGNGSASANGTAAADGSSAATAGFGDSKIGCGRFFYAGKPPALADESMTASTQTTCNRSFASLYSGIVRNPLWSAELLTKEALDARRGIERVDSFHEDTRLPKGRPTLADYRGSGWDRGHLSPDADMPSREAEEESYSLGGNIAPQFPATNRGSWAELEKAVRRQTRGGQVYVVTGTLYEGRVTATHDDGRVKVPTSFWKGLIATDQHGTTRGATVFIVTNGPGERWANMTVDQFTKVHRVDPFPGLEPQFRTANGATDGSMSKALEVGAKAASSGGANGGTGGSAGTGSGPPAERMVRSPLSGQYMSESQYRSQFNRAPRPEEYSN